MPSTYKKAMLTEMGVGEDGQIASSSSGRRGIGAASNSNPSSTFDQFRNQRSKKYHVAAEERSKNYKDEQVQLCYICQKPGHIAKDCKFGIS